jgi:hypothetical protein
MNRSASLYEGTTTRIQFKVASLAAASAGINGYFAVPLPFRCRSAAVQPDSPAGLRDEHCSSSLTVPGANEYT